jgi:hypothetical protein
MGYSCSFNFFEGKFDNSKLVHLLFDFVAQQSVQEGVGEENFTPVLLLLVLVLDGAFGDFEEVSLAGLVGVEEFEFLGDHLLEVVDVHVALLFLPFQLSS